MSYDRSWLLDLQNRIESLRGDAGYLIVSIGVRGPNIDVPEGNAVATVRMGDDEATAEALHLDDAISLARGKIVRAREAREAKRRKDAEPDDRAEWELRTGFREEDFA